MSKLKSIKESYPKQGTLDQIAVKVLPSNEIRRLSCQTRGFIRRPSLSRNLLPSQPR